MYENNYKIDNFGLKNYSIPVQHLSTDYHVHKA